MFVACKTIRLDQSFEKEARNLRILKQSLRKSESVFGHYAVIKHGLNSYVLMPYAKLGDLWQFLHGGKNPGDEDYYDFPSRFPHLTPENRASELIAQCWSIADALVWLHGDITLPEKGKVPCAHMDLKPSNILIDEDNKSHVGKWKISDFGLSVIYEKSDVVTVRDYLSQLSMNTRPKRVEGTYTAPEVKLAGGRGEKGVGLRSDVW